MWHNSSIHLQRESLSFKEETEKNPFALIDDFVDNEGSRSGSRNLNDLVYINWSFAIPRRWKELLRGTTCLNPDQRSHKPLVVINTKEVAVTILKPSVN